ADHLGLGGVERVIEVGQERPQGQLQRRGHQESSSFSGLPARRVGGAVSNICGPRHRFSYTIFSPALRLHDSVGNGMAVPSCATTPAADRRRGYLRPGPTPPPVSGRRGDGGIVMLRAILVSAALLGPVVGQV